MIRLLCIDDNPGMLEIVKFCIEADPNMQVDTTISSADGLERLATQIYDGVLVDLHMAGKDGLSVLREVRRDHGDLPVALLATAPESTAVIEALNGGADIFLSKGVSMVNELDEAVQRMVGLSEQRRLRRRHEERRRELERWVDSIADMVICVDVKFQITSANQVACRGLGMELEELEGKPLVHLVNAQDRTRTMMELQNFIDGFSNAPVRFRMDTANEPATWIEAAVSLTSDEPGAVGLVLSLRRVAEQVRMEQFSQDRSRRLEMVMNMTRHEVQHRIQLAESYLEVLYDCVSEKHRRRYLDKVRKNVHEVSRQMSLLQEFQEVGTEEPRWIELGALMEKARALAGSTDVDMQHDLYGLEVLADPLLESSLLLFLEQELTYKGMSRMDVLFQIGARNLSLLIDDDAPGVKEESKENLFELDTRSAQSQVLYLLREVLNTSNMTISERGLPCLGRRFEISVPEGRFRFQEPTVKLTSNYGNNAARPAS